MTQPFWYLLQCIHVFPYSRASADGTLNGFRVANCKSLGVKTCQCPFPAGTGSRLTFLHYANGQDTYLGPNRRYDPRRSAEGMLAKAQQRGRGGEKNRNKRRAASLASD